MDVLYLNPFRYFWTCYRTWCSPAALKADDAYLVQTLFCSPIDIVLCHRHVSRSLFTDFSFLAPVHSLFLGKWLLLAALKNLACTILKEAMPVCIELVDESQRLKTFLNQQLTLVKDSHLILPQTHQLIQHT